MIDLYAVRLDKIQTLVPDLYDRVLNTAEKRHVSRQKIERVRHQRVLSRAVLRLILSSHTHEHAQNIQIHTTTYGKPYLKNKNLYFNVSHTNHMLIIALSTQYDVGIDIEYQNTDIQVQNIPKQCFHPEEWEHFLSLSDQDKQQFFLKMWTQKEAASKAIGLGFHSPFQHINTLNQSHTLTINAQKVQQHRIKTPRKQYIVALASVSMPTYQAKPWKELHHEWIKQCSI
ncbi:MAG: 4'-phosphopantetheinyl transferase superfamily protein [Flavobacteriales bacterium]|nr:4'-phosphopantetheinyl transferase superfamily protein [Flavobacteriales bacterium]